MLQFFPVLQVFSGFFPKFSIKRSIFLFYKGAQKKFKEPLDSESRTNVLQSARY